MSSSVHFAGSGFFVAGASSNQPGTVRVVYSSAPKALGAGFSDDALHPQNYVLSGPGPATIVSINAVSGDPLSFDVVLAAPLAIGQWTITVSNVKNPSGSNLTAPTAAIFVVTSTAQVTPLSGGAENDDAERVIRKHFSKAMRGPKWDALIAAEAQSDDKNWTNAELAFDQLFTSSASSSWLTTRASDKGVTKPTNVGMSDELFRKLTIKTSSNKVVHEAIREILEVFYGQDSIRAFVEAEIDEDYNLSGNPDLQFTLDEKESFTHIFQDNQFSSVTAAQAVEVAFAITKTLRDLGSDGFAIAYKSPATGKNRVRIYSGSLGLGSFVRVTGGSAQNIFNFPSIINVYSGAVTVGTGYTWVYSRPDQNTTRISLTINTGVSSQLIDISTVREGDYVLIGQDAQIGITGTFPIKAVSISWSGASVTQTFDIDRVTFNSNAVQASNLAYQFFRPTKNSIAAAAGRTVVVAQTRGGHIDISIPATTQAVNRGPKIAAYGRVNDSIAIQRLQRLPSGVATITTSGAHGLSVGQQVWIDNMAPAPARPFITPATHSVQPATYLYPSGFQTITAETQNPVSPATENGTATLLSNGQILFAGGYRTVGGVYDGTKVHTNRYVQGGTNTILDATEADHSTQHTHTWTGTSDLNFAREYHAASTYGTGAIVSGGLVTLTPYAITNKAEQYILDGLWVNLPNMTDGRAGHRQVELNDGTVVAIGGAIGESTATPKIEIYNGTSWSVGTSMIRSRVDFGVAKLSDGRVLVTGGRRLGRGHDLDANTLALWNLDESAGPTAADQTGNYPLTHTGVPIVVVNGKINNCIDFNTANSHLTGPGNGAAVTALLGEWTLELWFRRTTNAAAQFATYGGSTEVASDNVLLNAGIDVNGKVFWKWENGAGVDVTQTMTLALTSLPAYRANFFNHLAVRKKFNGVNYDVTVFINGVSYQTWTGQANASGGTTGQWYIARQPEIGGSGFQGFIDDVRVSKIARTDFEILADFLLGWGNLESTSGEMAVGTITDECEIYDPVGHTWTRTGQMMVARAFHRATVLPGDYVLVTGGLGYDTTQIGSLSDVNVTLWPSNSLRSAEIWDPNTGRWTAIQSAGVHRHNHIATYLSSKNEVRIVGGQSLRQSPIPVGDPSFVEVLDLNTRTWKTAPANLIAAGFKAFGATTADGSETIFMGGNTGTATNPRAQAFIDGGMIVQSGGLNGMFQVTATPLANQFQISTTAVAEQKAYTSNFGANFQGQAYSGRFWIILNALRSALVTTITFTSTHNLEVGDTVYLNSDDARFPSGYKTITVVTANSITYNEAGTQVLIATPIIGTVDEQQIGFWTITAGVRTSNVTTLTFNFPLSSITAHNIGVGDLVYVNSRTNAFGSGLFTVTAVSDTTISYTENASNQVLIPVVGSVSQNFADSLLMTEVAATPQPINDPGPYTFDTLEGVSVTSTDSLTSSFTLFKNQQYKEVELATGDAFPDAPGYIVFGFGTEKQSAPVLYLGKYKSGPSTTRLLLDYSFKFTQDYPVGTKVTLLSQKEPFVPDNPLIGGAWITASSAGRVAAEASAQAALAAGINPDITIVYPGDRGLGGEGLPTSGTQKLSDVVGVFAGDDETADIETAREG